MSEEEKTLYFMSRETDNVNDIFTDALVENAMFLQVDICLYLRKETLLPLRFPGHTYQQKANLRAGFFLFVFCHFIFFF